MKSNNNANQTAIELVEVTKRFPNGVVSNYQNSFKVRYGEIHTLFGENGAGKSTLIKMILGEFPLTTGTIFIKNKKMPVDYNSQIANRLGLGVIHQHFSLIDNFTVYENVVLGYELKSAKQRAEVLKQYEAKKHAMLDKHQKERLLYETKIAEAKQISDQAEQAKMLAKFDLQALQIKHERALTKLLEWKTRKKITNFFDHKDLRSQLQKLIVDYDLNLKLDDYVSDISVAKQQKTEILKILLRDSNIIIFDEPTSVLSPSEIKLFLESLQTYKKQNKAVIFISHKIKEIRQVSDRVTVLKNGKMLGTFPIDEVSDEHLVELMVGGKTQTPVRADDAVSSDLLPKLVVKNLNLTVAKRQLLTDINFTVNNGEIVAIAGIEGNGQSALLATLFGLHKPKTGAIHFFDEKQKSLDITSASVRERQAKKIAYLSQDRLKENLLLHEPLYVNVAFNDLQNRKFFANLLFNKKAAAKRVQLIVNKYQVAGFKNPEQPIASLSGGNIQKFIIGRELEKNPELILINEPTWGVDVKSVNFLHSLMLKLKAQKRTFLFVSSSIDEIVNFADRVLVMSGGKIVGNFLVAGTPQIYQRIGDLMSQRGGQK